MKQTLLMALAGNANVGKTAIFNSLTGLHQHIGNWPGKTIERAEGSFHFKGREIHLLDLPGIYSLSTFSIEELISREYIAIQKPDVVINVVDASVLERNLFFTLQLIELETPMVMALNMVDIAEKKGIITNIKLLSEALGIPVIPTIATKEVGVYELVKKAVEVGERGISKKPKIAYGKELETRIESIVELIKDIDIGYPNRWIAIKLLEGDKEIRRMMEEKKPNVLLEVEKLEKELERMHGEPCSIVIASERYAVASRIVRECQILSKPKTPSIDERVDAIALHKFFGYALLIAVLLFIFISIFTFGDLLSGFLENLFGIVRSYFDNVMAEGILKEIIFGGVIEGVIAGITITIPYLIPFFIVLTLLEGCGYLARVAFLMDNIMHKIGLHGKAFIPLILGYGCNVPACLACRIMETQKERFLAGFITTLIPCAARTVIILGLVGKFVGIEWALGLYIFNLFVVFALGRIAFKVLPGESIGLIMEMPSYKIPSLDSVAKETWMRLKDFVDIAFPMIIAATIMIKLIELIGFLEPISTLLSPITIGWLGLPEVVGITLIFGILKKELTLILLAALLGTENLGTMLTPAQMIVFALVTMLYIPCIATIAALSREFGWRRAIYITFFEIFFAIFIGGIVFRLLSLLTI